VRDDARQAGHGKARHGRRRVCLSGTPCPARHAAAALWSPRCTVVSALHCGLRAAPSRGSGADGGAPRAGLGAAPPVPSAGTTAAHLGDDEVERGGAVHGHRDIRLIGGDNELDAECGLHSCPPARGGEGLSLGHRWSPGCWPWQLTIPHTAALLSRCTVAPGSWGGAGRCTPGLNPTSALTATHLASLLAQQNHARAYTQGGKHAR
jgi:hypothetical protein